MYLFLAVLGLRFMRGLSLVAASGGHSSSLSNCGSRVQLLRGTWDLPRPGLESVSPAFAGRLSTTVPPGKPQGLFS